MTKQKRKNFSKGQIAQYWIDWSIEHKKIPPWDEYGWDSGEPSCMACGYWQEEWDAKRTVKARWESTDLERCHIVPLFLGGADELANLVLMCKRCHQEQPDSKDPDVTYAYMKARTIWDGMGATPALMAALMALGNGATPEDATRVAVAKAEALLGPPKSAPGAGERRQPGARGRRRTPHEPD